MPWWCRNNQQKSSRSLLTEKMFLSVCVCVCVCVVVVSFFSFCQTYFMDGFHLCEYTLFPVRVTSEGNGSFLKGKKGVKNFYASRLYCEMLSFVSSKVSKDINSSELP